MKFATAVGPEIERPRDAPNVPADRQALTLVKPYQGMVAWPTVLLALGIVAAFALVTTLATMRIIPLWLGMIFNSMILYADQTPLHEACHGNIAGKDSRYLWINHLVGYVCGTLLLHEYKAFRYMIASSYAGSRKTRGLEAASSFPIPPRRSRSRAKSWPSAPALPTRRARFSRST